jgi:hypothetical protein
MGGAPGQAGAGSVSIPMPPDVSALKGLSLHLQAVFIDPAGLTLTNGARFYAPRPWRPVQPS